MMRPSEMMSITPWKEQLPFTSAAFYLGQLTQKGNSLRVDSNRFSSIKKETEPIFFWIGWLDLLYSQIGGLILSKNVWIPSPSAARAVANARKTKREDTEKQYRFILSEHIPSQAYLMVGFTTAEVQYR